MTTPVIIVPLDGTSRARAALFVSHAIAAAENAVVRIVHVHGGPAALPTNEVLTRVGVGDTEMRGSVLDARHGSTASSEILHAARESSASFIVLCTHTAARAPRNSLGRTALEVLHGARCPVIFVHPDRGVSSRPLRRILLPHDGTPTTTAVIPVAAKLAERTGSELIVVHVAADGAPAQETGVLGAPRYLDQTQHEWPEWVDEFVCRLSSTIPLSSLRLRIRLEHGEPAAAILAAADAESADLVVVAWRGDWDEERARTIKTILRQGQAPTMVIRV